MDKPSGTDRQFTTSIVKTWLFLCLVVAGCSQPQPHPTPELVAEQNRRAQEGYQAKLLLDEQREPMRLEYLSFISSLFPSLNGLRAGFIGEKLLVYHPFFNQYSFAAGPEAQAVATWINQRRSLLTNARIRSVGLSSPEGSQARFDFYGDDLPVMRSQGRVF